MIQEINKIHSKKVTLNFEDKWIQWISIINRLRNIQQPKLYCPYLIRVDQKLDINLATLIIYYNKWSQYIDEHLFEFVESFSV